MVACLALDFETRTIPLDVGLALRGLGLGPGARPGERVLAAANRAVEQARQLTSPRCIRSRHLAGSGPQPGTVRVAQTTLEGAVADALEGADEVIAVVCTIGPGIDARVSSLLGDDPLAALALDGLGSAACERLAEGICAEIEEEAALAGRRVTGPLSPGMLGWPLADGQRQLFEIVDSAPIGVVLTSSGQMIPRKTLSFLVGTGVAVRPGSSCPACGARDRCKFRTSHA